MAAARESYQTARRLARTRPARPIMGMDPEHDDYADGSRTAEPPTLGSLAVAFVGAFVAVLGPMLALMAFVAWSGFW